LSAARQILVKSSTAGGWSGCGSNVSQKTIFSTRRRPYRYAPMGAPGR
jgi:hypothetical protein